MKFQLGLFDQPCVADPSQAVPERLGRRRRGDLRPRPDPEGRAGVDHAAAQPEQRPAAGRRQPRGGHRPQRRLDDQPARRLERELAGRGRRRARVLHGLAGPDPAGHHGRRPGSCGADAHGQRAIPDQAAAVAAAPNTDAYVAVVGEKAYAEGLGDNPAPALPPDQQALISRAGGDRQAGGRRGRGRASGRARLGGEGERGPDGLPGQHRGRAGRGRRAVRQDRPQRPPADQLAVRRPGGRRGLQRRRAVAAGRPAEVLRPAARHRIRPGTRLQPALSRSDTGSPTPPSATRRCR